MLNDLKSPNQKTTHLLSILSAAANTPYIGEPVSQLEHSLQCAYLAAVSSPASDDETIVASLLHDVGQFIPPENLDAILGQNYGQIIDMIDLEHKSINPGPSTASKSSKSVGRISHETLGAKYLTILGFPVKVTRLVEAQVTAKRYLCAVDPEYHGKLSDASKKSLEFQGGPMTGKERDDFESNPWCEDMCRLRRWDDEAKVTGLDVPGLESYREMVEKVLESVR